jgi:hypothetical protein
VGRIQRSWGEDSAAEDILNRGSEDRAAAYQVRHFRSDEMADADIEVAILALQAAVRRRFQE